MSQKDGSLNILVKLFILYLNFVYKTSTVTINAPKQVGPKKIKESIVGFWHGESCLMYLVGKKLKRHNIKLRAIVTADRRGDYIEEICKVYGIEALRIKDGIRTRASFEKIKESAKGRDKSLCIALDGPLGPLHEPKKLAFYLAHEVNKPFVGIKINTSKAINLTKRWDNYAIPLPFNKIEVDMCFIESVNKEELYNFKEYNRKIEKMMI